MLGLAGLNLGMWLLQSGNLAWETHLGGFVAGALYAAYPRRLAKIRS
jgi:membrane associated rhomboid family serine protease